MGLTQKLGTIPLAVFTDSSNNVGIGGAASGSYKFQVTGTTNLTGALTGTTATFSSDFFALLGVFTRNSADTFIGSSNNTSGIKVNGTTLVTKIVSGGNTVATFASAGDVTLTGALSGTSATFSTQLKVANPTGSALDMLVLETGFDNPSGNKSIIWKDATNTLGRISVSYDAGTGSTMRFGSLYNGGYQSSDLFTIASTGAATFSGSVTAGSSLSVIHGTISDAGIFNGNVSGGSGSDAAYYGAIKLTGNGLDWGAIRTIQSVPSASWTNRMAFFTQNGDGGAALTERMAITNSGNVGIGTSSPITPLHLYKSSGTISLTLQTNNLYGYLINDGTYIGLGSNIGSTGFKFLVDRNAPDSAMTITSGGDISFNGGSSSAGNGTATPKNFRFNNDYSSGYTDASLKLYLFNEGGTIQGFTSGPAYDLQYHSSGSSSGRHAFYVANSEVMRINSSSVLIGTTSDSGQKLQVQGEVYSKGDGAILNVQARDLSLYYGFFGSSSSSLNFWSSTYGVAGTFSPTTGVYTATSDINKKKDFEDSKIGLNAILGLKPTLYRMKLDEADSEKQLGFIAQEVKEFIPQAYVENDDMIGLSDRPIIAALVKGMQEQQTQIEELKSLILNK